MEHLAAFVILFLIILFQAVDSLQTWEAFHKGGREDDYPLMKRVVKAVGLRWAIWLEIALAVALMCPLYVMYNVTGLVVSLVLSVIPVLVAVEQRRKK